tara:strand:- start:27 stop:266 length:240 start_codon:yes stop_codon:yes gene_type:complete
MSRKKLKKLGKAIAIGAALSGLGKSKTLTGETLKTVPVIAENIGSSDIENKYSYLYEFPTKLKGGGEVYIGKNVDEDLL